MKKKVRFFKPRRCLFLAGLLAAPMLAFNARAQNTDTHWSPQDVLNDGNGPYAYFEDPANWDSAVVPDYTNSNGGTVRTMVSQTVGSYVTCIITNDVHLYQLMVGDGGGGDVVITNGANVTSGVDFGGGSIWTGIGFPNGPSTLTIGPGCRFTCGDHLWVGQGTNNGVPNSVIVNGGTLDVHGQLGVSWNGTGGTNYITLSNGGRAFLSQWTNQTLGLPGNNSIGIMNIADNSSYVIVTNNCLSFMNAVITNNQLIGYGGAGLVICNYDPSLNITFLRAFAPITGPPITPQLTNQIVSLGGTASFHVDVTNLPVNYQWLFNGNPLTDGGAISGSATATLTISRVTLAQVGSYSVIGTNTTNNAYRFVSSSASLSAMGMNLYPVITLNGVPGNNYVTEYTASQTPPVVWTPFATNTVNSLAPVYVVDTGSPGRVTRSYQVIQP